MTQMKKKHDYYKLYKKIGIISSKKLILALPDLAQWIECGIELKGPRSNSV